MVEIGPILSTSNFKRNPFTYLMGQSGVTHIRRRPKKGMAKSVKPAPLR